MLSPYHRFYFFFLLLSIFRRFFLVCVWVNVVVFVASFYLLWKIIFYANADNGLKYWLSCYDDVVDNNNNRSRSGSGSRWQIQSFWLQWRYHQPSHQLELQAHALNEIKDGISGRCMLSCEPTSLCAVNTTVAANEMLYILKSAGSKYKQMNERANKYSYIHIYM